MIFKAFPYYKTQLLEYELCLGRFINKELD